MTGAVFPEVRGEGISGRSPRRRSNDEGGRTFKWKASTKGPNRGHLECVLMHCIRTTVKTGEDRKNADKKEESPVQMKSASRGTIDRSAPSSRDCSPPMDADIWTILNEPRVFPKDPVIRIGTLVQQLAAALGVYQSSEDR